jgi:hypothetical protein
MDQLGSIAVLAFTDMSAAKDQDWFCDGIAEAISHAPLGSAGCRDPSRNGFT